MGAALVRLQGKLAEIHRLLLEAYDHYFATGDGHCKSSEAIVSLTFPDYWEMKEGNFEPKVEVWSYVLGPSRSHWFDNIDLALEAVRSWHKAEMTGEVDGWWDEYHKATPYELKWR